MNPILAKLFSVGSGGIGDAFKTIADAVHLDPTVRANLDAQLQTLNEKAGEADEAYSVRINEIASANIVADASSADWFVRRARPAFLWVIACAIAFNLIVGALLNFSVGRGLTPIAISPDLLSLYKIAFLGYVSARTLEKTLNRD